MAYSVKKHGDDWQVINDRTGNVRGEYDSQDAADRRAVVLTDAMSDIEDMFERRMAKPVEPPVPPVPPDPIPGPPAPPKKDPAPPEPKKPGAWWGDSLNDE